MNEIKDSKGIHLAHMNVRSLMNKWDMFKAQFATSNIHIIGISETWLNEKLPTDLYNLSNDYVFIRNDRTWHDGNATLNKKGGGVGIFVNSRLPFSESTYSNFNRSSQDIESQWICLKQDHCKPIVIGSFYRPPQGNVDSFITYLEETLLQIELDHNEVFLMGDLNIDFLDKNNVNHKKLLDMIKSLGLRQLIKEPTRVTINSSSCIDLFITNSDTISNVGVDDINISDHLLILCTRKKIKLPKKRCDFIGRSYRNYDVDILKGKLIDGNWNEYDNIQTVTGKWNFVESTIRIIIDDMCPMKSFKIKQKKEPWITNNLIIMIKDNDLALKRAKKSKNPELWKEANASVTDAIRE